MNTTPHMTSAKPLGVFSIIAVLGMLSLLSVMPAQAATYDWTGTNNGFLINALNWNGGVAPTGTDIARWNAASYTNVPTISGTAGVNSMTIGQLLFDAGNTGALNFGSGSGTVTLNGISTGGTNIGIQMNSGSGAVDLKSTKVRLGASQTWLNNSSSTLTFSQGIFSTSTGTPYTLTIDGTGNISTGTSAIISNGTGAGTTAITKSGTGTLTLGAANTFSGGLIVNSGTVSGTLNGAGAFGSSNITLGDTNGSSSATLLHNTANTSAYASAITVRAGSSNNTLSINTLLGNATFSGAVTLNNALSIASLTAARTNTMSGIITGGSGITIGSGNVGTVVLTGNNTYSGDTRIRAGTLAIGSASGNVTLALQNSTLDLATGDTGTLRFGTSASTTTTSATVGGLKGSRNLALANANTTPAAVALTVGGNNGTTTYSGILSGADGSLTKTGTGALTLSGANTYSGATTINSGLLTVNGTNTSSAVAVNSTGTLGGSGSVGAVTVTSGGTISPGNSPGTLTVASSIWNDGGNYNWQLYNATGLAGAAYDTIASSGNLNLSSLTAGGFKINLWTINALESESGSAINFDANGSYSWSLASFGSITGFDASKFTINTSATNGTAGFNNSFTAGGFNITTNGSGQLLLTYQGAAPASPVWTGSSGNLSTIGTTNGSALVFTGATGGNVTNNQVSSLSSVTFSNTAGAYNFSGNALTNGSGGIVNNSTATQTVSLPLTLGANQSFDAANGNLAISGNVANNGNTLTLAGASNTTVSGVISGSGGLTKTDGGSATLSGINTFTGKTTVSAGTLILASGSSLASSSEINLGTSGQGTLDASALAGGGITIGAGQTLSGYGTVVGNTTIASGGALAPGNSPGILDITGDLTLNSGSTSIFEVAAGVAGVGFDQVNVTGVLAYGGVLQLNISGLFGENSAFANNLFTFGSEAGNFSNVQYSFNNGSSWNNLTYYSAINTWQMWDNTALANGAANGYVGINLNTGMLTVVPEPSTWALVVGGVSTLVILRRRNRS